MASYYFQEGSKLVGTSATGASKQGNAVSIYQDTVAIGGPNDNSNTGATWIFTRSLGTWSQQQQLIATSSTGSTQGTSVSLYLDTVAVGAPAATSPGATWIFTRSAGVWSQQQQIVGTGNTGNSLQGTSVSVYQDTVAIGGPSDNSSAGATWIWTRTAGVWSQQQLLIGTGATGNAAQGTSVSVYQDTVAIGGPTNNTNVGATWIWTRSGSVWTQQQLLIGTGNTGASRQGTAVSVYQDTVVIGGSTDNTAIGAVWVWTRTAGVWTQLQLIVPFGNATTTLSFGCSVSIYNDTIIVGAYQDNTSSGNAYVYVKNGTFFTQIETCLGTGASGSSQQGTSVAVSKVGTTNTFISGGPIDNTSAGAAWIFDRQSIYNYNNTTSYTIQGIQLESHSSRHSLGGDDILTLTNGNIWVGNSGDVMAEETMSGDATISNTGVLTLSSANSNPGIYNTRTNPNFILTYAARVTNVYDYFPIYFWAFYSSGTMNIPSNLITAITNILGNTVGLATTYIGGLSPNITFNNSSGTITINETGISFPNYSLYLIHYQQPLGAIGSNIKQAMVEYTPNGSGTKYFLLFNSVGPFNNSGPFPSHSNTGLYNFGSGDTLVLKFYQNSGSTISFTTNPFPMYVAYKINSNIYSMNYGSVTTSLTPNTTTTFTNSTFTNTTNLGNIIGYSGGSNNGIIINVSGFYILHYQLYYNGFPTFVSMFIYDGTRNHASTVMGVGSNTGANGDPHYVGLSTSMIQYFAAGTTLQLKSQISNTTTNLNNAYLGDTVNSYFNAAMIIPTTYILFTSTSGSLGISTGVTTDIGSLFTIASRTGDISFSGTTITLNIAGIYMIYYQIPVVVSNANTVDLQAYLTYNGGSSSANRFIQSCIPNSSSTNHYISASGVFTFKSSDTLNLQLYCVFGAGTTTVSCTATVPLYLNIVKLD